MIEQLLPDDVVTIVAREGDPIDDALFPEEEAAIARAVEKRQREFRAGRACARAALARLGFPAVAIPVAPDRAPVWPAGVIGSITHSAGLAAAAVARKGRLAGIGLDAETDAPLEDRLARLIWTESESARLAMRAPPAATNWPKVIFSAKEAVHKVVAPLTGVTLGFHDVDVLFDDDADPAFAVLPLTPRARALGFVDRLTGRYAVADGYVAAAVTLAGIG